MSDREKTCRERVRAHYNARMKDIRKLWALDCKDPEATTEEGECWNEYGLCFDYVPRGTFTDEKRGFWRFQLSTGGPGDEFRFYCDEDYQLTKVEYWFLDWFDGACVAVTGKNRELWNDVWENWLGCELPQESKRKAKC